MSKLLWFQVELDTLLLQSLRIDNWPAGMESTKSRMCEECLESIVACRSRIAGARGE